MKLPWNEHLFVIGAQKAGTTWLQHVLDADPRFRTTIHQEAQFFSQRNEPDISEYPGLFRSGSANDIAVDVTPTLLSSAKALDRIIRYSQIFQNPPRFVVLFREPVDRAYSAYRMYQSKGETQDSFREAFRCLSKLRRGGEYSACLKPWLQQVPKERFLFLIYEEVFADTDAGLAEIESFLELNEPIDRRFSNRRINSGNKRRSGQLVDFRRRASKWLREKELHSVIHFMKQFSFPKQNRQIDREHRRIDEADLEEFRKYYFHDVVELSQLIERDDLPHLWGYDRLS